jgi:ankyrin repeat protein
MSYSKKNIILFIFAYISMISNSAWSNADLDKQLRDVASGGSENQLNHLIKKGANVDAPGKYGKRPLMFAAESGNINIVVTLLSYGAEVNARTKKGDTALTLAALNSHAAITALLIEFGANIHDRTRAGLDSLMIAAKNGNVVIVRQLLQFGADVRSSDRHGNTALIHAIKSNYADVVEALFNNSKHIAPCVPNNIGVTPLMTAINGGNEKIIEIMLPKIKHINFQDNFGSSALHYAAEKNNLRVVKYLVNKKQAQIDMEDLDKETPLFYAVRAENIEVVKFLLANKASKLHKNSLGITAYQLAAKSKNKAMMELLK